MSRCFNGSWWPIAARSPSGSSGACKELGIEAVAVYSQADRDAPYLALADRAICIGKGVSTDSYLNINRLIAAAEGGRRPGDPPRLRLPERKPELRRDLPKLRLRVHRPPARGDPPDGAEDRGQAGRERGQRPMRPRLRRANRRRRRSAPVSQGDRLPRSDQGGGGRWRQGDAGLPGRVHPRLVDPVRPQRGGRGVQEFVGLPRKVHRPPSPH